MNNEAISLSLLQYNAVGATLGSEASAIVLPCSLGSASEVVEAPMNKAERMKDQMDQPEADIVVGAQDGCVRTWDKKDKS